MYLLLLHICKHYKAKKYVDTQTLHPFVINRGIKTAFRKTSTLLRREKYLLGRKT